MRKKIIVILLCFLLLLSQSACTVSRKKNVVLVTDESGTNGDYINSEVYKTLNESADTFGFNLIVNVPSSANEYENVIEQATEYDPALIIISSEKLELETVLIAMQHPTINFCIFGAKCDLDLNGVQDSSNIYSIVFDNAEQGFLCGIYAGLITDRVMFVGDYEYKSFIEFETGFRAGLKCVNNSVTVKTVYISPQLSNEEYTSELTQECTNGNYRLLYTISTDKRIYETAANNSIYVLGTEHDCSENFVNENINLYLFYIKSNVNKAIYTLLDDYYYGRFKGQVRNLGVSEEALSTVYVSEELLNDYIKSTIDTYYYALYEDIFAVPTNENELKAFSPPDTSNVSVGGLSLSMLMETIIEQDKK